LFVRVELWIKSQTAKGFIGAPQAKMLRKSTLASSGAVMKPCGELREQVVGLGAA
jgi:hypothetical protein